MSIVWFENAPGGRGRNSDNIMRVTFTAKPKGVRFNATLSRSLHEKGVTHVQLGIHDNVLLINPVDSETPNAFKVTGKEQSLSVTSSAIGIFAAEHGLTKKRIDGEYDKKANMYKFNLAEHMEEQVAATEEGDSK